MRTYVVPLVLPNGEKLDLIVNSKGQDMACVFPDAASSKEQFALTPRMEREISNTLKTKGLDGLQVSRSLFPKLEDLVKPETMEEFTRSLEKDELLPDSPRKTISKVKEKEKSADIKVNGESIEGFASDVFEYDVNIDPTLDIASIVATTNSSKAKFKVDMGNRDIVLNYGSNVVDIIVISESGVEQLYRLNITREDIRSTDTTLSSLTVDGVSVKNFRSNVYKYNVIKYKLGVLDIVGTPNDEKSTVTVIPPATIVPGDNNYIITVTSENGNTANYTIIVNNVVDNISKKLKNLSVKGYDIDFDKNNNIYEISYNKTKFKDLHIYFTTVSNKDLVSAVLEPDINNDKDALSKLRPGDVLTVTITGIDGESVKYTINITEDNRVNFFLVLELFLMAVVIIVVAIVLNNRKKNATKKKTTKTTKSVSKDSKTKTTKSNSKEEKPKKKKFSIFEEEEEEDLEATKELSKEELNLK